VRTTAAHLIVRRFTDAMADANSGNSERLQASHTERFSILYSSLLKFHEGFVGNAFKVAGFQLLVIGWLLTSVTAQKTLSGSVLFRALAVAGLILASFLYGVISCRVWRLSNQIFEEMRKLQYMPESHYSDRLIRRITLSLFVSSNWLLTLVSCILAWFLR